MRIPVVDTRGVALMPCTPARARHLFKSGRAKPKRNKLGLFYVQLCYKQEPNNQQLVAGVDPGSKFEGLSVVGAKETVLNLMVEAPDHVKDAVETRRTMRRARRQRKWRRPKRFDNRLNRKQRLPPSTRSRWEAKARVIAQLLEILPPLGLKRGTVVRHGKYGLCTLGGFDRKRQTISLHEYRSNKRLTQKASVKDCRVLTWVAFRSWLVANAFLNVGKGDHPTQATKKGGIPCVIHAE